MEDTPEDINIEELPAEISMHAISGSLSAQTMCLKGLLKRQPVTILIDSGSTHNFIDRELAKRMHYQIAEEKHFEVMVANGEKVAIGGKCSNLPITLQDYYFTTDFYVFPLGGCDVVLGAQWLHTLGPILWDFSKLSMQFTINGQQYSIKGSRAPASQIVSSHMIEKLLTKNLLRAYDGIFGFPSTLPPRRPHDHRIPLISGSQPQTFDPIVTLIIRKERSSGNLGKCSLMALSDQATALIHPLSCWYGSETVHGGCCSFGQQQVEYLGHIISREGVATDPQKIACITELPTPKGIKALRGFLGLTGYYRKFVKDYGKISAPLTNLLKKDSFHWNDEASLAFNALKEAMVSAPVLALPNFSTTFILECDASGIGIGGVLMQEGRPIAFTSKALSEKHRALPTYEKEMMAILHAVNKWRQYLLGRHFIIYTDHRSLKYLMEQRVSSEMQQKWTAKLLGYDYEIRYKKGVDNSVADALSRQDEAELIAISYPTPTWVEQIRVDTAADESLQAIIRQVQSSGLPHYTYEGGLLRYKQRLLLLSRLRVPARH
uniref:RNA-directed DNA polymerase n=1 Tax=Ananas comosus var. bracteatus TaxID=296719 RepID=A0A6V7NPQ2_ANACO|nr:unnamed protein product [Ananas comosus var. bracteatus]